MAGRPGILAQLARAAAESGDRAPLPLRLCRTYVHIMQVDGGAITLAYTRPERVTICVTDETAERLEDIQEVLGEGPGPDAYRSGGIVVGALNGDQSAAWPMFTKAARSAVGGVSLYAFPMRSEGEVLGVLTVYQSEHRELPHNFADAQFLADAVAAAIVRDSDAGGVLSSESWAVRDKIHQATGMVVAQLAISPEDALALMRAYAFSEDLSLGNLAIEVVERRRDFSLDSDTRGNEES